MLFEEFEIDENGERRSVDSIYYDQARKLMDENRLDEAIRCFQLSLAKHPHFKTLELLGECLLRLGRFKEAIVPLAAASFINPQVRAPSLLAEAYLQYGDSSYAKHAALTALEREPNNRKAKAVLQKLKEIEAERNDSDGAGSI